MPGNFEADEAGIPNRTVTNELSPLRFGSVFLILLGSAHDFASAFRASSHRPQALQRFRIRSDHGRPTPGKRTNIVAGPSIKTRKASRSRPERAGARIILWDREVAGFCLRVTPAGVRTYGLKYRFQGAQKWFSIGRHGSPWTVDEARKEARRLLSDVAKSVDPAVLKVEDRRALTVAKLCDLYLAEGVAHKKESTLRADKGRIERHIKPLLGRKRVDALTRGDVERLVVDVIASKTAEAAPKKRRPGSLARGGQGVAGQCATLRGKRLSAPHNGCQAGDPHHYQGAREI